MTQAKQDVLKMEKEVMKRLQNRINEKKKNPPVIDRIKKLE
jgi:hypothetical protein